MSKEVVGSTASNGLHGRNASKERTVDGTAAPDATRASEPERSCSRAPSDLLTDASRGIVAEAKYHLPVRTYSIRLARPPFVSDNFWLVRSEQPTPKEVPRAESGGGGGSGPKGLGTGRKGGERAVVGRVRVRRHRHRKRVRSMQLTSVGSLFSDRTAAHQTPPHTRRKQTPKLCVVVGRARL